MFSFVWDRLKRATFFEKLLLVVGLAISIIGFYLINRLYVHDERLTWSLLQAAFLYLLLIFMVILTDSNESIKEELKVVIKEHAQETKLLKELVKDEVAEIKLLRKDLKKRK